MALWNGTDMDIVAALLKNEPRCHKLTNEELIALTLEEWGSEWCAHQDFHREYMADLCLLADEATRRKWMTHLGREHKRMGIAVVRRRLARLEHPDTRERALRELAGRETARLKRLIGWLERRPPHEPEEPLA